MFCNLFRMNELNESGRLPLDLALSTQQISIAASLVDHKVKISIGVL